MKRIGISLLGVIGLGLLAQPVLEGTDALSNHLVASANSAASFTPGTFFTVTVTNQLEHFNVSAPGVRLGSVNISGLQPNDDIVGIDFRPATGQLYGLGRLNQLYVINTVTGAASPVGGPFTPVLDNALFGFDFNPTVDRIRVVSSTGQNLRLNPDTGQVATVDTPINPATAIEASAYTNNFAGATTTTLYGIDPGTDKLYIQNPPNDGIVTPVGPLGVDANVNTGFDIAPNGTAYAALFLGSLPSNLYTINLATGVATLVGAIGGGGSAVRGLAFVAGPETVFAVTSGNNLLRFNSATPGSIVSTTPITGLQAGETVLGIDFRPATGQLYGLGSTSRIYRIDFANGVATQVGGTLSTPLTGTDFGVDFNPTLDRLRVVSDAEQNLAIHPDTAAVTVNTALNPTGNVVAAAYSNNVAGAVSTTLYDVDSTSDLLLIQSPPANGTLSAVGPLNVNTTGLTGFDIAPSGMAFASLTAPAAASSNLYTLNLTTGAATLVGTIGGPETIRDIAVRVCTEVVYGVTQGAGGAFNLITFNAASPGTVISTVGITGLQAAETIVGADFRPATGQLYAIGSTSRLYRVNVTTGAATQVGSGTFSTPLSGTSFGVDFNPMADRIRVVSDTEQNLSINPDTAAVTAQTNLNPAGNVVAAAYSNNFAGALSTTLYDVDSVSDMLLTQIPASGALTTVGSLTVDVGSSVGFDIASGSGNAYLSGYLPAAVNPTLFTVNLGTGGASVVGTIPTTDTLVDITVALQAAMAGVDTPATYSSSTAAWFLRNSNSAGSADVAFTYGSGGATLVALKGDWDGDGDDTVGVYDTTTGGFLLRNGNSPGAAEVPVFTFGAVSPSLIPISGDWDGDGDDTIGIYDSATGNFFLRNSNTAGAADIVFAFGSGGAIPISGDWNNDNTDTIGIYIASTGTFFLRNSNSSGPADVPAFTFGGPGNTPLAGDWNGDGTDSVGFYNSATGAYFLSNGFSGSADFVFTYGAPGSVGLTGDWDGL